MKTNRYEHLSALLDDEAGEFERRRLLDELCGDSELGKTLNRYTLAGEVMRSQQRTVVESSRFLAAIQAQLEDEPVYNQVLVQTAGSGGNAVLQGGAPTSPVPEKLNNRHQSGSGMQPQRVGRMRYAVAAAVALAALAGVLVVQKNGLQQNAVHAETLAEIQAVPANVAEVTVAAPESMPPVVATGSATDAEKTFTATRRRMALADASFRQQTADTVKQYVTLHMQYRTSNGIAPSIQAVSYAK